MSWNSLVVLKYWSTDKKVQYHCDKLRAARDPTGRRKKRMVYKKGAETSRVPSWPLDAQLLHHYCTFKPLITIQDGIIRQALTRTRERPALMNRDLYLLYFQRTLKRYWSSLKLFFQQFYQSYLLFHSAQLSALYGRKRGRLRGLCPAGIRVVWHVR